MSLLPMCWDNSLLSRGIKMLRALTSPLTADAIMERLLWWGSIAWHLFLISAHRVSCSDWAVVAALAVDEDNWFDWLGTGQRQSGHRHKFFQTRFYQDRLDILVAEALLVLLVASLYEHTFRSQCHWSQWACGSCREWVPWHHATWL